MLGKSPHLKRSTMQNVLALYFRHRCSRHCNLRNAGRAALALLLVLLALYAARQEYAQRQQVSAVKDRAQLLARSTAAYQQTQLEQAQQILTVLSGISPVQQYRAAACNAFLTRQLDRFPQYNNLAFVDPLGAVRCRAKPLPAAFNLPAMTARQDKPYLFAVQQNIALALPYFTEEGQLQGVVVALLPSANFFPMLDAQVPGAGHFTLIDAQGKQVLAYPAPAPKGAPFIEDRFAVKGAAAALQLRVHLPAPARSHWHWGMLLLALGLSPIAWRRGDVYFAQALKPAVAKLLQWRKPEAPPAPAKSHSDTQILRRAYADLKGAFLKKEQRVRQLVHLDELSQRLQSCASRTELTDSVGRCAQAIFPGCQGALFLRTEAERYGLALAWGGNVLAQSLQTLDCHALHSGKPYVSHGASAQACAHAKSKLDYACIPLQSVGGPLGLLYLAHPAFAHDRTPPWAATAIAERTSIALGALQRQEQLQRRAIRDALTGLFNRGFMEEALAMEQQRALRRGSAIGVMLLDVDHFKRFNDSYGHAAGDTLLRGIGGLMQHTVREGDMPCRYGGEEFVVILPGADLATTHQRAEALRAIIEQWRPEIGEGVTPSVTVSIGVACYPQHGMTWQALLKRADLALYAAKHAGRNRVLTADAYKTTQEAVPA